MNTRWHLFRDQGSIDIAGRIILHVGNWGYKNIGDAFILAGLLRRLQSIRDDSFHIVMTYDPLWQESFLAQMGVDMSRVRCIGELPKGYRSLRRSRLYGSRWPLPYRVDTIVIGGGEIMTEESGSGYRYRRWSIMPFLIYRPRIYLMGGIQPPTQPRYRRRWSWRVDHVTHVYARTPIGAAQLYEVFGDRVSFVWDTSVHAYEWTPFCGQAADHIIVNINPLGEQYRDEMIDYIQKNKGSTTRLYYLPMTIGSIDSDIIYYERLVEVFGEACCRLLSWGDGLESVLTIMGSARLVVGSRLHCYLIAVYLGHTPYLFSYQYKLTKVAQAVEELCGS